MPSQFNTIFLLRQRDHCTGVMQTSSRRHDSQCQTIAAPASYNKVHSPFPVTPRRRGLGRNNALRDVLTKEMIGRAFPKSPCRQRTMGGDDFNSSIRSFTSKEISVECGKGPSRRRSTSPRRTIRGRMTPGCRKPTFQKSEFGLEIPFPAVKNLEPTPATDSRPIMEEMNRNCSETKRIEGLKVFFAELRPKRRKVKFNHQSPADDADARRFTRIQSLNLEDLCIHGHPTTNTAASHDFAESISSFHSGDLPMQLPKAPKSDCSGETLRTLESNIRKSIGLLGRLDELIKNEKVQAQEREEENQRLRRELIACLPVTGGLSIYQSQRQLSTMIAVLETQLLGLDEQNTLLKYWQTKDSGREAPLSRKVDPVPCVRRNAATPAAA